MTAFFVPLLLILAGLVIITIIVIRHFPQAASIDLESLPAEQEAAMKSALMERRLKRKMLAVKNKVFPFFRRMGQGMQKAGRAFKGKVARMEQRHRRRPKALTSEQQEEMKQKIRQLLQVASEHVEAEKWSEAENKYIEVLSWDPKNLDAFFGLSEVYIERKEFGEAKEILAYLLKLVEMQESGEEQASTFSSPATPAQVTEARYDHAVALQALDAPKEAGKELAIVVKRDPKNPRYLDKAVELSILLGEKDKAKELLETFREVNPDNQKIQTFEEQIRQL